MSYVGTDFDDADPNEIERYSLDFAKVLDVGDAISTVTWDCVSIGNVDTGAASRIRTAGSQTGTITTTIATNLQVGVKYRLRALATTTGGSVKSLWAHVSVKALS